MVICVSMITLSLSLSLSLLLCSPPRISQCSNPSVIVCERLLLPSTCLLACRLGCLPLCSYLHSSLSALTLASGAQHLEIFDINIGGLGTARAFGRGYYIEVSIAGHVAIKTKTADYDPVNKVYRITGVWSIPGGMELKHHNTRTPED